MEDAMDMSLDDYINSFKPKPNANNRSEESNFKEGRRKENDDGDEMEDELTLLCEEDDYVSLAPKNTDLYKQDQKELGTNDLRNKIAGRFPKTSQQWRLEQPNIMNIRPAGMPPLVPSDAPQNSLNGNGNRSNWRNYNHKNRRRNWNYNNWQNNNNYNNNYRNYNNNNNGRIQRFNNNNSGANLNSKNIKIVLEQLKQRNPMILYSAAGTSDLTIEASTSHEQNDNMFRDFNVPTIVKADSTNGSQSGGFGAIKNLWEQQGSNCNVTQIVKPDSTDNGQSKGSEAIKSLLGVSEIGIRNDMMPSLAGKLLEILNGTNNTIHKPMYDMKIQKEIHEIQKKPLLYKCPGGEVVSSDGTGIADCKIQPKVSGISLNNRFA